MIDPTLHTLAALFRDAGHTGWLVGGAVRDLFAARTPTDFDIATDGDGTALARAYADRHNAAFVNLDDARGTGRIVIPATTSGPRLVIDIATLRAADIATDLRMRDFSINALALPLATASDTLRAEHIIDPCGGLDDLRTGRLRLCGPSSLHDDPLRVLRAARIAAHYQLQPDPDLTARARQAAPGLSAVAGERIRDELLKLLSSPVAATWLRYLDQIGALTTIIPELEPARTCAQPNVHFLPVLAHILETVASLDWLIDTDATTTSLPIAVQTHPTLTRQLPYADRLRELLDTPIAGGHRRRALLKLAALLHDNAKPQTQQFHPNGKVTFYQHQQIGAEAAGTIARRLRLSRTDNTYVVRIVREHMRPGQLRTAEALTQRAVVRFFRDLEEAGPDVLIHELADHLATRGPHLDPAAWDDHLAWVTIMLDAYWNIPEAPQAPLVGGDELMQELGLSEGPLIGMILKEIAEARAAGEVASRTEALELAHRIRQQPLPQKKPAT
jgi:tRNA nucleotidyltransferase/poly(A) polymerase